MAAISGRVTIVAANGDEYAVLLDQVNAGPPYSLVSSDEPTLTLVVDLTGA